MDFNIPLGAKTSISSISWSEAVKQDNLNIDYHDELDFINLLPTQEKNELAGNNCSPISLATPRRKACKNCTCGLAEELQSEEKNLKTSEIPKGGCGSCYLGDAFRCSKCPFLGLPAFKPGEEVKFDLSNDSI